MAQFVDTSITIEGKKIKQFSSLTVSQNIFDHHNFRLVCPSEAIDDIEGAILNSSKNLVGGSISIRVQAVTGKGAMQFNGVVTQVEALRHSGHAGDIIVSGYSPTILLDSGPHCKTWEKKAIKNIATDVLSHFPQNLLQPKVSPVYGETLSYMVQYRETAWQFLTRLAATYGEWLFYDGQKLVLGSPQGSKSELVFGNNLHEFSMALQVRPAQFSMMSYDYMNHQVYTGSPRDIPSKAGLNEFGKLAYSKSEKFYGTAPKQWHNQFLTNKKQLDDYVNTQAAMQSSNMVRFKGHSGHPGLQVGGIANIKGRNVYKQSDEAIGDYFLISVNHQCDGLGNYSNQFVAVPSTIKMPPVSVAGEPHCETQSAVVTDNHDPKGLGRIRVKFHWMGGTEKSPWLRITGGHGGGGKGMFFIPELNEEVIVGFEGNSPTKPYVIGSVYNSNHKTEFSNKDNDVKAIQTRSGNKIVMNDKEGSVFVEDKGSNSIKIDGKGNINVLSAESIVLTCGESKIEMKKDGTINITGKKVTVNAQEKATVVSKQASFTADGNGGEAKVDGVNTKVNGSASAKVSGAKTDISASGNVAVKGALITLN